jgi:abortive infection bacteriophage resistance protein
MAIRCCIAMSLGENCMALSHKISFKLQFLNDKRKTHLAKQKKNYLTSVFAKLRKESTSIFMSVCLRPSAYRRGTNRLPLGGHS